MESGLVRLDEIGCCALTHAFLRNPEMTRRWGVSCRRFSLLYEIFNLSTSLAFMPDERTTIVYRAFATAELERINRERAHNRFVCRHATDMHRTALQVFLSSLPKSN